MSKTRLTHILHRLPGALLRRSAAGVPHLVWQGHSICFMGHSRVYRVFYPYPSAHQTKTDFKTPAEVLAYLQRDKVAMGVGLGKSSSADDPMWTQIMHEHGLLKALKIPQEMVYVGIDDSHAAGACLHKWQKYVGLTEAYDFCIRCDAKKEVPK